MKSLSAGSLLISLHFTYIYSNTRGAWLRLGGKTVLDNEHMAFLRYAPPADAAGYIEVLLHNGSIGWIHVNAVRQV